MKAFFDGFPKELIDSAIVDGCSRDRCADQGRPARGCSRDCLGGDHHLPLDLGMNSSYAFVFTSTSKAQPVTVVVSIVLEIFFVNWNQMCAGALLAALPGIIFVFNCAEVSDPWAHRRCPQVIKFKLEIRVWETTQL